MTPKKSKTLVASAVSLALSSMMLSASLNAGTIVGALDKDVAGPAANTTSNTLTTGVASWDQANITVLKVFVDPVTELRTEVGTFADLTADIDTLVTQEGDSFVSKIYSDSGKTLLMAQLTGKDWPVGGPTGIKAVNNDIFTNNGKPFNCLLNTGFTTNLLDSVVPPPNPVICSSGFQSHKRFKIAMLEATVDGVVDGDPGNPVDLVINVADDGESTNGDGFRHYQVFSKINNYTGKRLKGYKIIVGTGTGAGFVAASEIGGVGTDKLSLSLGVGEGSVDAELDADPKTWEPLYDGSDIFNFDEMATFSHGLFGPIDGNFTEPGFFDDDTAGFNVSTSCQSGVACPTGAFPITTDAGATVDLADTIESGVALPSNYVNFFGDWLPSVWAPQGLFTPDPVDPEADPILKAWWNGTAWIKYDAAYNPVQLTRAEYDALIAGGAVIDVIEDVLNLGPSYILKVGDGIAAGNVTIRIVPVVADTQPQPAWVGTTPVPPPADAVVPVSSSGGGGCAVGGNGRFDPTLPALLAAGLGFFGWRRFKAGK
jgi:hypothetical protein